MDSEWRRERTGLERLVRFLVFILAVLFIAPSLLAVSDASSRCVVPSLLGGARAYVPSFSSTGMLVGSVLVGLVAGLITGVIGAGGGYIITPALMSLGVRGIMAVGTSQFHIFANAIIGTFTHRKHGNVNFGLAIWNVAGSIFGITLGGHVSRLFFQHSPATSDLAVSIAYVVLSAVLGGYCIAELFDRGRNRTVAGSEIEEPLTPLALRVQALRLGPVICFDEDLVPGGRSVSVLLVVLCGFVVGFAMAIMGVGGGLLTFPMFVYGLGVSTCTTVGTSILQILLTTSYSSIVQYGIYGFVFYTLSIGMLVGSLVGVHIGTVVTGVVPPSRIRVLYALSVLAGFVNRACVLPDRLESLGYIGLSPGLGALVERIGTWLFFALLGAFALDVIFVFVRSSLSNRKGCASHAQIADPKKLGFGIAGLAMSAVFLITCILPWSNGVSALTKADNFFNQLSKSSANFLGDAENEARHYEGKLICVRIQPGNPSVTDNLIRILHVNGLEYELLTNGWLEIRGDMGRMACAAIADARLAFRNDRQSLECRYSLSDYKPILCWWDIFSAIESELSRHGPAEQARFARLIVTKVLEPAYNFRGIEACSISQKALPAVLLLVTYILFTLLYGFSIFLVFEGLGITTSGARVSADCSVAGPTAT
ncbi:MAG: sulfite exporter TauE/SafE family protein [Armatimonadota bacterium]